MSNFDKIYKTYENLHKNREDCYLDGFSSATSRLEATWGSMFSEAVTIVGAAIDEKDLSRIYADKVCFNLYRELVSFQAPNEAVSGKYEKTFFGFFKTSFLVESDDLEVAIFRNKDEVSSKLDELFAYLNGTTAINGVELESVTRLPDCIDLKKLHSSYEGILSTRDFVTLNLFSEEYLSYEYIQKDICYLYIPVAFRFSAIHSERLRFSNYMKDVFTQIDELSINFLSEIGALVQTPSRLSTDLIDLSTELSKILFVHQVGDFVESNNLEDGEVAALVDFEDGKIGLKCEKSGAESGFIWKSNYLFDENLTKCLNILSKEGCTTKIYSI